MLRQRPLKGNGLYRPGGVGGWDARVLFGACSGVDWA